MGIIAWIVLGAIAGFITNLIMGGSEGVIATIILGSSVLSSGGYLAGTVLKVADVTGLNIESIVGRGDRWRRRGRGVPVCSWPTHHRPDCQGGRAPTGKPRSPAEESTGARLLEPLGVFASAAACPRPLAGPASTLDRSRDPLHGTTSNALGDQACRHRSRRHLS